MVDVRIPAGAATGSRLRLAAKGNAGSMGAPAGDLYITIRVEPHALFTREGDDVHISIPVSVTEAGLGAKIEVPTVDGRALLKIPQPKRAEVPAAGKGCPEYAQKYARRPDCGDQHSGAGYPRRQDAQTVERTRQARSARPAGRALAEGVTAVSKQRAKAAYMISAVAEKYQTPSPDAAHV